MRAHHPRQRLVAEELIVFVHRFGDAVGVEHEDVARGDRLRVLLDDVAESLARAGQPEAVAA